MLVVEERFCVADGGVLGLTDMVFLAHVVIPVDAFGEEAVWPVVMFRCSPENRQAIQYIPSRVG